MRPTDEQHAVIDAGSRGESLRVIAFAGTGKTSTLRGVADANPGTRFMYLAFNRAMADEARASFPRNVEVRTAHSLAFRDIGYRYKDRLTGSQFQIRQSIEKVVGSEIARLGVQYRRPAKVLATVIIDTLARFYNSRHESPNAYNVPKDARDAVEHDGGRGEMEAFCEAVGKIARQYWETICLEGSQEPVTHDFYLKLWHLSNPRINADAILFDEAQDASPVMMAVVEAQDHAQRLYVGDRYQQIYAWRGAVDALDRVDLTELALTKSFRFGQEIADYASEILACFGETRSIIGRKDYDSRVLTDTRLRVDQVDAVLCRTNLGVLETVESAFKFNLTPAVVGGIEEICRLVEGAWAMYRQQPPKCRELALFRDWQELEEFSETDLGRSYRVIVRLVLERKQEVITLCEDLRHGVAPEAEADLVVSTVHKAKGRQWNKVALASDFNPFAGEDSETKKLWESQSEANLLYVAVTRAAEAVCVYDAAGAIEESFEAINALRQQEHALKKRLAANAS